MRRIVAVSGGVDSVVLLHMLASHHAADDLIVAHFEHGIRAGASEADARFVEGLSKKYGLPFEICHGELTQHASEADARQKRYDFLRGVAKKYEARIVTAHHQDDLVETIALNFLRGTGWRGLAVFGDSTIDRPLMNLAKAQIYTYALEHDLEWVEDETNQSDKYTRNRLRRELWRLTRTNRQGLVKLHELQGELRRQIDTEVNKLSGLAKLRYFMTMIPESAALELLRLLTSSRITRPQSRRLLLAIKTARPGTSIPIGDAMVAKFTLREFSLETSGVIRGKSDII